MNTILFLVLLAAQPVGTPADVMNAARARLADRDRPAARALFEQAATACLNAGDPACAGAAYNQLGLMARQDAVWKDVGLWYGRAAEAFERAGMVREQALAIRAIVFDASRTVEEHFADIDRASRVAASIDDPEVHGLIQHIRGDLTFVAGRYAESQRYLEEALALLEKANNPGAIARVLTSLGRAFRLHGRPDLALEQYRRAFAIQETLNELEGQAQSMNAMSIAHMAMGNVRRSVVASEQALALARRSGFSGAVQSRLGNLGVTYLNAGRFADAEPILRESIRLQVEAGSEEVADYDYLNLAEVHLRLDRAEEALAVASRGLELARRYGQPDYLFEGHHTRAQVYERLGRMDEALADATRAVELIESMRSSLVPEDALKQGFAETNRKVYATLIRLLVKAGRDAEALLTAERGRARAFLDLLATRSISAETDPSNTLLRRFRDPSDATLRSFVSTDPQQFAGVATTAKRLDSHVLTYWVDTDAITVWVVSPAGAVNGRRLDVSASRLERLVRATWQTQAGSRGSPAATTRGEAVGRIEMDESSRKAFRELYDALILPVRRWLPPRGEARLTIVPHGPLFRLSFAAMTNERGQYLIEGYSLHYAPSIAVLELTAARRSAAKSEPYVLIADPDVRQQLAGETLGRLPAARRETDQVAAVVGGARTVRLTGAPASETRVRQAASSAGVLHFATHGIVPDDRPFEAFLALGGEGNDPASDGRLTAREVYDLTLNAQLVVLSGCRTATGTVTGDGVLGLTRAFLYAGTPSLMATLWDVYDDAGAHLLPAFYAAWLKSGDKADALRRGQLALIRDLRAGKVRIATPAGDFIVPEHPAFWAGFVLVGEP